MGAQKKIKFFPLIANIVWRFFKKIPSYFWRLIEWATKRWEFWFAFIPNALLVIFVVVGLDRTNKQLDLLREQMTTVRKPVIRVYSEPSSAPLNRYKLIVSNVGNDTAMTFLARFGLFLINDSEVYSFNQFDDVKVKWGDSTRSSRQNIWPRLHVAPGSEFSPDTFGFYYPIFFSPYRFDYHDLNLDSLITWDVYNLQLKLGGKFVLFIECNYRKPYDFSQMADSFYFFYEPFLGPRDEAKLSIGGTRIIDRIKEYMQKGPERIIMIRRERYEIYVRAHLGSPFSSRFLISRNVEE